MPPKKEKVSSPDYPQIGRTVLEVSGNSAACKPSAGLYLIATPIGHMGDITLRALVILSHADVIACEDTRTSNVLLKAFGITTPTISYHDHNADQRRPEILQRLERGEVVALISDAGMPAIADPGFKLVRDCRDARYNVTVIPGPNAAVTALAMSGLPTDQFSFAGFPPSKPGARKTFIASFKNNAGTIVFYESPQRLAASLQDMSEILGPSRPSAVARELTKFYEEIRRDTLSNLASHYAEHPARGEIVILVGKNEAADEAPIDTHALLTERLRTLSLRDAVAEVADMTGLSKKEIYAQALLILKSTAQ